MEKTSVSIVDFNDYYQVNVDINHKKMSTGMIVGIVLGFIFFLVVGIILLIVWATKTDDSKNITFNLKKENWKEDLDKQLLLNDFGANTNNIKTIIINRINAINK